MDCQGHPYCDTDWREPQNLSPKHGLGASSRRLELGLAGTSGLSIRQAAPLGRERYLSLIGKYGAKILTLAPLSRACVIQGVYG